MSDFAIIRKCFWANLADFIDTVPQWFILRAVALCFGDNLNRCCKILCLTFQSGLVESLICTAIFQALVQKGIIVEALRTKACFGSKTELGLLRTVKALGSYRVNIGFGKGTAC